MQAIKFIGCLNFKEAEIQAIGLKLDEIKKEERESKSERERERWFCMSRRSGIWERKDHALWVWEIASDTGKWRDERVRTFFFGFFSFFFLFWSDMHLLAEMRYFFWYGWNDPVWPVFKPEWNTHVFVSAEVSEQ